MSLFRFPFNLDALILSLCFLSTIAIVELDRRRKHRLRTGGLPYPPGPPQEFILGNARQMPEEDPWRTFSEWGRQYGPLTYLNIAGQPILVLNSQQAATDLLDKKGTIYSDRPRAIMCGELIGMKWLTSLIPYGPRFKAHRKLMTQLFNPRCVEKNYGEVLERRTTEILQALLDRPDNFFEEIKFQIGAIIVEIAYGRLKDGDVDFIQLGERNGSILNETLSGWMVDYIPALIYLPEWFPGAGFKRKAKSLQKHAADGVNLPFATVKRLRSSGQAEPCFVNSLLDENDKKSGISKDEGEEVIRDASATLFAAGSETNQGTLNIFILAMSLFPEVQKRAQTEIDLVTKGERLPTLADRDNIPYITNIVLETLRWKVIAPIGGAHRLIQDDIYNGYFIPEGTIVFSNLWGTANDPANYSNPDEFNPERFAGDALKTGDVIDPRAFVFGFGRRVCPGRHLGLATAWIGMARLLSVFDITKATDPDTGEEVEPEPEFGKVFVSLPGPFKCKIRPRSGVSASLIREAVEGL